jgi:hypothetical protein
MKIKKKQTQQQNKRGRPEHEDHICKCCKRYFLTAKKKC